MTGTTIMAITYNDGILLAADTRTSMGTYVSNRVSNKITKLTDRIYCCRSGSAADTQMIANIVSENIKTKEMITGRLCTVYEASKLCSSMYINMIY